jgi:uncharacterized membrane protein
MTTEPRPEEPEFSAAEVGAIAHLYRGEMYRSKIWRTRLDATTNWAVVTTGIAMSIAFSDADATPLPIVLVSFLVTVFWVLEARRYRLYDIWRTRVRVLEANFYGPLLRGQGARKDQRWNQVLATTTRACTTTSATSRPLGAACAATTPGFSLSRS